MGSKAKNVPEMETEILTAMDEDELDLGKAYKLTERLISFNILSDHETYFLWNIMKGLKKSNG